MVHAESVLALHYCCVLLLHVGILVFLLWYGHYGEFPGETSVGIVSLPDFAGGSAWHCAATTGYMVLLHSMLLLLLLLLLLHGAGSGFMLYHDASPCYAHFL